ILKDTLTLGALAWAFYAVVQILFVRRKIVLHTVILLLSCWVMYSIKIYILLCFLPAVTLWVFLSELPKIKNYAFKIILLPIVVIIAIGLSYWMIIEVGEDNQRYNLENLTYTAEA